MINHPVTVESNLLYGISRITGLTYDEMKDPEVQWFMCRGVTPISLKGPFDGQPTAWQCMCSWWSPRGRAGSARLKEAVRQHLRDKHQIVRRK